MVNHLLHKTLIMSTAESFAQSISCLRECKYFKGLFIVYFLWRPGFWGHNSLIKRCVLPVTLFWLIPLCNSPTHNSLLCQFPSGLWHRMLWDTNLNTLQAIFISGRFYNILCWRFLKTIFPTKEIYYAYLKESLKPYPKHSSIFLRFNKKSCNQTLNIFAII